METFVVRIWVPGEAEREHDTMRGVVEQVSSGRKIAFDGGRELLAFLVASRAPLDAAAATYVKEKA